jgi:hypothetical protein
VHLVGFIIVTSPDVGLHNETWCPNLKKRKTLQTDLSWTSRGGIAAPYQVSAPGSDEW